jgi:3',5'-cyclic AMP phosphodiesterase CpdA
MILFAHVSDTHFGSVLANTANGNVRHQDPHSLALCLNLYTALENVRAAHGLAQAAPLPVVHSGDLTLSGGQAEFAVAQAFMRSRFRIQRDRLGGFMGLEISDDRLAMVPGNHDHWSGLNGALNYVAGVPGFSAATYVRQFEIPPWTTTWHAGSPSPQSPALELFGVDSSSGLPAGKSSRWAKGAISAAELNSLEALLKHSVQRQRASVVRAIICHHSLSYQSGVWSGGLWQSSELDAHSRDELLRLCDTYHVVAVLTGHTHDFHHEPFLVTLASGAKADVHELRCASTLAINHPSVHNGFWVHKVSIEPGGRRVWQSWRHGWNGSRFVGPPVSKPTLWFSVP